MVTPVDSNLTPALGPLNTVFSFELEQNAINLVKNEKGVIWYKFDIGYYTGEVFPNSIKASYGIYKNEGGSWKREPAKETKAESPAYPVFEFEPFNMKLCDWEPNDFANVTRVTLGFANIVKDLQTFTSFENFLRKITEAIKIKDKTFDENVNLILQSERDNLIKF
ncbi:hypothetical protein [Flavobacterium coralii]|uniref:hypothetical protein n=1 Tax=Flavobacterium coralii TaxID=2838017 RepID=UPI000C5994D1|nr:hypothetical protein [Flavobacterium sp.]